MTKEYIPLNVNISSSPNTLTQMKTNRPKFYCPENIVDEEYEDFEDANKVIEESPNGRWSKLDNEIFVQKLIDFDSAYLAIDTEKGSEVAWNEMRFRSANGRNRFENIKTLEYIYEKLKNVLKFLVKLEHSNLLKFYDYWYVDNPDECKLVVITEYSSAGSLKKLLDSSKMSQTKIKPQTYKRWLNQILYTIKCLHNDHISIFQGHLNSETIFIQNSGVIKLTPTLLSLNGICEVSNNVIKCSNNKKPNIDLTNEIMIKDLHAIGLLALEIFNAHIKIQSPTSPSLKNHRISSVQSTFDTLSHMVKDDISIVDMYLGHDLQSLDDDLQKDFVMKCFEAGENVNIDSIWFHPFINNILSLKVLSVFSILNYFQNSKSNKRKLSNKEDKCCYNSSSSQNHSGIVLSNSINIPQNDSMTNGTTNDSNCLQIQNNNAFHKSGSSSSLTKSNSLSQLKYNNFSEKRKVSLTFLTNYNNLKIPQDFFGILEDIRAGLYPRLFKHKSEFNASTHKLRSISSSSCLDFVIQQKQIIDRRSSFNLTPVSNSSTGSLTKVSSREEDLDMIINKENDAHMSDSFIKYPTEMRRIISENCWIKLSDKNPETIELTLDLRFDDNLTRCLSSYFQIGFINDLKIYFDQEKETLNLLNQNYFKSQHHNSNGSVQDSELLSLVFFNENTLESKIENISNHLANELIDQGLINPKDQNLIAELFFKTIREYLSQ